MNWLGLKKVTSMGGNFIKKTIRVLPAVATLHSQGELIRYVIDADYPSPIEQVQDSPLDFAGSVGLRVSGTSSVTGEIGFSVGPIVWDYNASDFS